MPEPIFNSITDLKRWMVSEGLVSSPEAADQAVRFFRRAVRLGVLTEEPTNG